MASVALVLGSVTFQSFEVPARITGIGGEQGIVVHQLLGGARVIDALGRDDHPISWSGAFRGANAQARADAIDQIRVAGQAVNLTWADRSYSVIVKEFTVSWERTYQQPYSITCIVVQDNSTAATASTSTLDDLVGGDTAEIDTLTPSVTDPTIAPAIASMESAITAVGTLQGASLTTLGPALTAAQAANQIIDTSLAVTDSATFYDAGSVAGVAAGGFPTTMIATFEAQSALIAQQATLREIRALTGRVQTNLAQATG